MSKKRRARVYRGSASGAVARVWSRWRTARREMAEWALHTSKGSWALCCVGGGAEGRTAEVEREAASKEEEAVTAASGG